MFGSVVVCLLAASSALAERSLSVQLSGASSFASTQAAIVTATLMNTGDEELILLNNPASVLSDMSTDKFSLRRDDGRSPRFVGAFVDYAPEEATSFTTLAPGKSVSIAHSLADAYDFSHSGSGEYSIEPASSAFLVLTEDGVQEIFADIDAHTAHLASSIGRHALVQETFSGLDYDGDDGEYERNNDVEFDANFDFEDSDNALAPTPRRPRFIGCSAPHRRVILSAAQSAQRYARDAYAYLYYHDTTSPRYREWFGTFTSVRRRRLLGNFQRIDSHQFGSAAYNCTCQRDDWRAYVYANQPGMTWLCKAFWTMPATGASNRGGTLVHEASHWNAMAGAQDVVYGQVAARNLARRQPERAMANADSHRFFAENLPYLA